MVHVFLLSKAYDTENKEIRDIIDDSMLLLPCWHPACC
jgi:hypothetical protein